MSYYVYILRMVDSRLYVGMTNDLNRRESEHGAKPSTRTTHIFGAGQLLYSETFPNRERARKRERQIKKWSQAKKEALIRGDFSLLKNLSKRNTQFKATKLSG